MNELTVHHIVKATITKVTVARAEDNGDEYERLSLVLVNTRGETFEVTAFADTIMVLEIK